MRPSCFSFFLLPTDFTKMGRKRQRKDGQNEAVEPENTSHSEPVLAADQAEAVETEAPSSNIVVASKDKIVLEREEKSISEGTTEVSNLFSSLNLSENTRKSVEKLGFKTMTQVCCTAPKPKGARLGILLYE
jgi:hypothetical protein